MSAPDPCPRLLLVTLLASAAAAAAAVAACSNPDTQSPNCTPNVDQYGIHLDPNGCDQFATCDSTNVLDCCVDADGGTLKDNNLATCRHGYGDPDCAYLAITFDAMMNVTYMCSATPSDGGTTTDGGADGGTDGGKTDGG